MSKEKKANYSPALTAEIIDAYSACETDNARKECIEELSHTSGKTVRSLRMKLVKEGVYIKPAYVSKAGEKSETKSAIVESIAAIIGVTSDQLNGLDKATVAALKLIRSSFVEASEAITEALEVNEQQAE